MIEHGKTQSTIRPNAIDIDEYSVWVATDIKEVKTEEFEGFSYTLTQYSKDEYILQIAARDDIKSKAIMELSDMVATLMEG
ncbi:hypothetical protein EB06_01160 [Enterococcus cecorum]|uniref:hypothetical protein n=1 Tax=Enterococcus cecorum TaxID=44008 RepID=UPI000DEB22BA|nr:hypothetical protein [Enterococcus cecorum]RBR32277.1 hypothetical protein EB06_01160 [Enterococcus cecorum]